MMVIVIVHWVGLCIGVDEIEYCISAWGAIEKEMTYLSDSKRREGQEVLAQIHLDFLIRFQ
jgi:hypothetical protein